MIPEIGLISLIMAFFLTAVQSLNLIYKTTFNVKSICLPVFSFITISFFCLTYSFLTDDFSVLYIANNSNSQLPVIYKISAVWGAHEGSLLLWVWLLSLWVAILSLNKTINTEFLNRALSILGMIMFGFLLFIIKTSNPFVRLLPEYPLDGNDLNPMLQDIGLAIHPPILYMGYVGFAVAFSFAIAILIKNDNDKWLSQLRPWVLIPWSFLTLGIALGSFWAYYELGWGGWWFWDPVENASFMPWLTGTALIHCLIVSERKNIFIGWSIVLSIATFTLSLLGTFLVRSGVVTSVHSFASDPTRGFFILQFMAIVIGSSLVLLMINRNKFVTNSKIHYASKESGILANNLLLITATGTVLIGTLFPIFYEVIFNLQISVGYPYFNSVFIPIASFLFFLMSFFPTQKWNKDSIKVNYSQLIYLILIVFIFLAFKPFAALGISLFFLIIKNIATAISKSVKINNSLISMSLAHLGIAITILGISLSKNYEIEKDVKIKPGDSVTINNYNIAFTNLEIKEGKNFVSFYGTFDIKEKGNKKVELNPEKRVFIASETPMSETAIHYNLIRDIYIALGEQLSDNFWSVRIYYKPFIRFIWIGAIFMALGGLIASTRRFK